MTPFFSFCRKVIRKAKASKTLRFLLFQEENPTHKVAVELEPWHIVLAMYYVFFTSFFGVVVFFTYGLVAFFFYYLAWPIFTFEGLHIIFDR